MAGETVFWDIVSYLFGLASYVKDIKANLPLLTFILDRADVELTRLARIEPQKPSGDYHFFSYEIYKSKHRPHWSCLQIRPEKYLTVGAVNFIRFQTNYIAFVSQIPLTSYVQAKIFDKPSLLFPVNKMRSPAEAAVMTVGLSIG